MPELAELSQEHILPHFHGFRNTNTLRITETQLDHYPEQPCLAVDPETKHEIDDAIWAHKKPQGPTHISIVVARAGLIAPDSFNSLAALEEGTSIYDSDNSHQPMIKDTRLVTNTLSLVGDDIRPGVAYSCDITNRGKVDREDIEFVKVRAKEFTYAEFGKITLAGGYQDIFKGYNNIRAHFSIGKIGLGAFKRSMFAQENKGKITGIRIVSLYNNFANSRIGSMMEEFGVPWVYRYFEPSEEYELNPDIGIEHIKDDLAELLEYVSNAFYSSSPRPHTELGLDNYSHNTSPLRRGADYVNHMILEYIMTGGSTEGIDKRVLQKWVNRLNALIIERNKSISEQLQEMT